MYGALLALFACPAGLTKALIVYFFSLFSSLLPHQDDTKETGRNNTCCILCLTCTLDTAPCKHS